MNFNGLKDYTSDYGSIEQNAAVTILFADYLSKLTATDKKVAPLAIVRGIEKEAKFLMSLRSDNQEIINNEHTKTDPRVTILRVEIPTTNMFCPKFLSFINGKMSLEEFESSLFLIDISGLNLKRIPRVHEVIQIKYENLITPLFDGFPTNKIILDPYLSSYSHKRTKGYFK